MSGERSSPGLRMAVDYAPLIVFFLVNFLVPAAPMMRLSQQNVRVERAVPSAALPMA